MRVSVLMVTVVLAWSRIAAGTIPAEPVLGCARLDVTVPSVGRARVVPVRGVGCGPLGVEADSSAHYDARRHVVHLRIRVLNQWTRHVTVPVRLISWPDSFGVATADGPRSEDRGPLLRFSNADSTVAASAPTGLTWVFWRLNTLTPPGAPAASLAPGERTGWRTVDVALTEGHPLEFILELRVEAERQVHFDEDPPLRSVADFITNEAIVTDQEWFPPGWVLASVAELIVPAAWSARDRQTALDNIRGVVIGAMPPSGRDDRVYIVRLDADSSVAPIVAVRQRIGSPRLPEFLRPIVIDSLLASEYRRSPMFASPVAGCATIHVVLAGGESVVADTLPGPRCGPIVPTVTSASFDARARVLHLHVVLTNAWSRDVTSPARVFAWDDSLKRGASVPPPPRSVRPPPPPPPPMPRAKVDTQAPAHTPSRPAARTPPPPPPPAPRPWGRRDVPATWINADSSIGRGASDLSGARLWRYDDRLSGRSGRDSLGRAASSNERTLDLRLEADSITDFSLRLVARAENAHFVPALPPASGDPPHAFDSSRILVDSALFGPTPVSRDLIDVTFGRFSTQLERQAAVDSIGGEIVGGFRRDSTGNGTYIVRIAGATSATALAAALEKIRAVHVVSIAMPIEVEGAAFRYADERTPLLLRGCSTLRVELSPSGGVTAATLPAFECGPIVPTLAGTPTFDSASRSLHLPIALVNGWSRGVVAPIELYAWNDSIAIERPTGLTNTAAGKVLRLTPPDEGGWSDGGTILNTPRWSFQKQMSSDEARAILREGARTPARDVVIRVQPGNPTAFTIRLRAQARRAQSFSVYPPAGVPPWVTADSNRVSYFSKHVLLVAFREGASRAAIQAALDSVDGAVISGAGMGLYVVRIPGGATLDELARAQSQLRALAVIQTVILWSHMEVR